MSTERTINSSIKTVLINNDDFSYAHLVKFERPFPLVNGKARTNANRYAYYTDGATDIVFDGDTYRANRILAIGQYSETTKARATSMALTLAAEDLGASVEIAGTISTGGVFSPTNPIYNGYPIDFVEEGFKEGDSIKFKYSTTTLNYIITGFTSNNASITMSVTGTDADDSSFPGSNLTQTFTIEQDSIELNAALMERGITANNTSNASPTFVNREVFVHKVFIDPETGTLIGGNSSSILIFKGIIASVNIDEMPTSSKVKWNLTSHWGDFEEVNGRLTTDEIHRALDSNKIAQIDSAIRPEYAADLGFMHGETSLSAIANYKTQETRTRMKSKKRGGLAGLFGGKKYTMEEYQVDIQNEVDLNVHLQGKYLPVVYGVQRVNGNPIFADTLNSNSKIVYTADAICEGEIHGLFNIYIDDVPLICTDDNDFDVRNSTNGSDKDNTQLQCFGRMSRGNTIAGKVARGTSTEVLDNWDEAEEMGLTREQAVADGIIKFDGPRGYFSGLQVPAISPGGASGLEHGALYNLTHPYSIEQQFMHGRPNQLASDMLVGIAQSSGGIGSISVTSKGYSYETTPTVTISGGGGSGATATANLGSSSTDDANTVRTITVTNQGSGYTSNPTITISGGGGSGARATTNRGGFKRQTDYWTSNMPYWSTNHRLLDTAYSSMKFEIDADATTIPEVEYVVKGKILDCYNYDNTYRPDVALGASDAHTNFTEGDLVVVETSVNGSSWVVDSTGTNASNKFKIMDKWLFTTSRGTSHYRFRLDTTPNLGLVNARATDKTRLRLKDGSGNTWHMLTWDHEIIGETTFPDNWVSAGSNVSVNGSGNITISGISSANKTKVGASNPTVQFYAPEWYTDTPGPAAGLKYAVLKGAWSGSGNANVLTFASTNYTGVTFPNTIKVRNAIEFNMTGTTVANITNAAELTNSFSDADSDTVFERGGLLHNLTTGESREIVAYGTGNKLLEIETPFLTPAYSTHKFKIDNTGNDKRASSNPAIQTLDFLMNKKFGRGLEEADLDLSSFVTSAKLCDARSDITIRLANSPSGVQAGDTFEITQNGASGGVHVASGTVATGGVDVTNKKVTLTNVINKFAKKYSEYVSWSTGDIVYTTAGAFFRATGPGVGNNTEPTASGSNLALITGTVDIHKTSGSGSVSTLNMAKMATPIDYSLYDSDWVKYWRYFGWEHHHQSQVTRHQTNFILDTGKSVFQNVNALLTHFNGILAYENGKYILSVETQEAAPTASISNGQNTNPYYIDETDIVGKIGVVDNSQKNGKNTIKASLADPQLNWGTRSVTFFNSDFLKADRNVVKTGTFPYTGITNYYNARINTEKELFQTRFSKEVSFELGPRAMLLRAGQVISMNYEPFGWTNKLLRIENLNFKANCNVSVKCREYDDSIYEITKQQASRISEQTSAQYGLKRPSPPTMDTVTTNKIGSILLTWVNSADFVEGSDSTEIWKHSSDTLADATLLASVDNASSFMYNAATNETAYFWVRHTRYSRGSTGNKQYIVRSEYNASAGTLGTALAISAGAQTVKLLPSTHVIDYSKVGDETTTVNFTTVPFNMSGILFYDFLVGTVSKQNTQTTTFSLADGDEPAINDAPVVITVKVRQGSAGGTIVAQDNVSIFAVQDGQSAITGFLTNESHTVATAVDGSGASFTGAGGTFKVYYGNQDITSNAKVTFAAATGTNITGAINSSSGVYTLSNFTDSQTIGSVVFTATILGSIIGGTDGVNDVSISKTYSIAKSKAGVNGTGSAGENAKTVHLTASDYSIVYDKDGATPNPSTSTDITLTAIATNFVDPYFKFTGDASTGTTYETSYTNGASGANGDTFTFNVPTAHFSDPRLVRVGVSEAAASTSEIAFDTVSIFGIKPGQTGAEGDDGYTIICSNEAHTFPAASNGAISTFVNSGTDFEVFSGGTQLTGLTSGTPGSGQFTVSAAPTGITAGAQSASSNKIVFADHSGMGNGTATASIVYTLNIENTTTVTKKQTFTKSVQGATGTDAYSGLLTNENSSAVSYEYINEAFLSYSATGGEFKTFSGTTELTSGVTYGGGATKNGLTLAINSSTGVYTLSGNSWTTDSESFTLTATKGSDVISKEYNINKLVNQGKVELSASDTHFKYDGTSANPAPSTITLTAQDYGYSLVPLFKFEKSTNGGSSFTTLRDFSTTTTLSVAAGNFSTGNELYKVTMKSNQTSVFGSGGITVDTDEITLGRIRDGSTGAPGEDGDDGDDGNEVAEVRLYKAYTYTVNPPSAPSGATYNFVTKVLTPPSGWLTTPPTTSYLQIVYASVATVTGASNATSVSPGTFSTPTIQFGVTPTTNYIFKRSANKPTTPSPLDYQSIPSTWYDDVADVPSGSNPIWSSFGKAAWNSSNRTFITTWQEAVQQEGSAGDEGVGSITIYRESSSNPGTPTAGTTNPPTSWYSTVALAKANVAGNTLVWFSVGNKPAGSSTITWNTPIRYIENYEDVGGTKPPSDANKFETVTDAVEGRLRFKLNNGSVTDYDVFSSTERTKLNNLRQGNVPDGTVALESTTGSQSKASAAEAAAKLQESNNRVTFPTDNTEGRFSFQIGSTSFTNNVFSSAERTKLNNLRAGTLPGGSGSLESTTGSQSKATAAQTAAASDATSKASAAEAAAKLQESNNRVTFPTDNTEGRFSFSIGGGTAVINNVFSSAERTKLNNLRNGKTPGNAALSIINSETTKANVGLSNVDNTSDATIVTAARAATTATDVGLGNVDNTSDATIVIAARAATTKADVGLGSVSNTSLSDIRSGVTKDNVGLGLVSNTSLADVRAGVTKANVGLSNVDNTSDATIVTAARAATTKADVGLGSVSNTSLSDIRSGVTKDNVGLGNVDNTSDATIVTAARAATTKADVGLGSVSNTSLADIRSGVTAANVGLGNVSNESKATMFASPTFSGTVAGVTKGHVGLGSVDNTSDATVLAATHTGNVSGTIGGVANSTIRDGVSRANSAIDSSNRLVADFFDGSTTFTRGELFRIRGGFSNVTSGALTLNQAVVPTIPTSKGGTGVTDTSQFLNANITEAQLSSAGAVAASSLAYGEIGVHVGTAATSWSFTSPSYNPTATTQTVTLTISHPTLGTSTVVGTWTRTNLTISGFALGTATGMSGSGSNNWTFGDVDSDSGSGDNAFGSTTANNGLKTIYVQHSNSNKRFEITAQVFTLSFSFKCLTPAMLPENLQIGDEVDSPLGKTKVIDMQYKEREGYYILEDELEITNDHPILIDGEWILAEEYAGKKEYIDKPTEVVYVETENELLTVKNWTVGGKY
jgi:hypothetical protein